MPREPKTTKTTKTVKKPKSTEKKKPTHPSWEEMVARTIIEHKSRTGSSRQHILKTIAANYPEIPEDKVARQLRSALKRLQDREEGQPRLVVNPLHTHSFRVSPELKKKISDMDKKKADPNFKPRKPLTEAEKKSRAAKAAKTRKANAAKDTKEKEKEKKAKEAKAKKAKAAKAAKAAKDSKEVAKPSPKKGTGKKTPPSSPKKTTSAKGKKAPASPKKTTPTKGKGKN